MRRLLFSAVILFLLSGCVSRPSQLPVYFAAADGDFERLDTFIAQGFFSEANAAENSGEIHMVLLTLIKENKREWVEKIFNQRTDLVTLAGYNYLLAHTTNITTYNYLKSRGFHATPLFFKDPVEYASMRWILADLKDQGIDVLNKALEYSANAFSYNSYYKNRHLRAIEIQLAMGADLRALDNNGVPIYQYIVNKYFQSTLSTRAAHLAELPYEIQAFIAEGKLELLAKIAEQKQQRKAKIIEQKMLKTLEKRCLQNDDMAACKKYANLSQDATNIKLVKEKIDQENAAVRREEQKFASLKKSQKCQLKEQAWFYRSNTCKKGLAQGKGLAVHRNGQLKFEGIFKKGVRISGLLSHGDTPMYDGPVSGGRPDGIGICFHQNEPEECKYYKGKRVDVIYKQRIAMLEQQRIMDEKISKMGEMQKAQLDAIERKMRSGGSGSLSASGQQNGPGSVIGDIVMDKVSSRLDKEVDKLVDKGINKLFDHLF